MTSKLTRSPTVEAFQAWTREMHFRLHPERKMPEHLCNAMLGLGGELEELFSAKSAEAVVEEAGDVLSYLVFAAELLSLQAGSWSTEDALDGELAPPPDAHDLELTTLRAALQLQELVKKQVFQGKVPERQVAIFKLSTVMRGVLARLMQDGRTARQAIHGNMLKLAHRYRD